MRHLRIRKKKKQDVRRILIFDVVIEFVRNDISFSQENHSEQSSSVRIFRSQKVSTGKKSF